MAFVKVVKNKSYFKRYQVKYRRRREGKTDYQARRALVIQDKNKYASPKYRFVVRFTNKDVICQVTKTLIDHDEVMCAAYAHELKQHGLTVGLTNYAAAYATGLLCARRVLKMLKLDAKYPGLEDDSYGEDYNVEPNDEGDDERNPFRCFLDVGLTRTSTGNRVFAAMKGACDGGLDIPHNEKRFAGYADKKLDSDMLRKYILGGHVGEYMDTLEENDPETYKKQFSKYIAAGVDSDNMEAMYTKCHASIRADPFKGVKKDYTKKRPATAEERLAATEAKKALRKKNCKKSYATARLTYDERKAKIEQYKNDRAMAIAQLDEDDE